MSGALITVTDKKRMRGYFAGDRWSDGNRKTHEIALNFVRSDRTVRDILGTLVHEMCHQWQHELGNPSRSSYHNKEWGEKMKEVGLFPSSTGQPGGRQTGQQVSHFIIEGGAFDVAFARMQDDIQVPWRDVWGKVEGGGTKGAKPGAVANNKTKYSCKCAKRSFWGKPDLTDVSCKICDEDFLPDLQ